MRKNYSFKEFLDFWNNPLIIKLFREQETIQNESSNGEENGIDNAESMDHDDITGDSKVNFIYIYIKICILVKQPL